MKKTLWVLLVFATSSFIASAQTAAQTPAQTSTTDQQSQPASAVSQTSQTINDQTAAQPAPARKKAKHVYTNDDMKAADPNDVGSASASSSGGAAVAAAADAKDPKAAKSTKPAKKADENAIAAQQAKVDALKKQVDGTSQVVADIQRLISEQPSRAEAMGPGLTKNQTDLSDLQKQLASAQSQLDSMKNPK